MPPKDLAGVEVRDEQGTNSPTRAVPNSAERVQAPRPCEIAISIRQETRGRTLAPASGTAASGLPARTANRRRVDLAVAIRYK
jgi:hypothetical protein